MRYGKRRLPHDDLAASWPFALHHWPRVRLRLDQDDSRGDALIRERCQEALRDLSHMEQIKKFIILTRPFSVEADELTVSLKMRRKVILLHYASELEELYRESADVM